MTTHSETPNVTTHLRLIAAGLAVIGTLISGMTATMFVLVYDGLMVASGDSIASGADFDHYASHAVPVLVISFLLVEALFAWGYFRYAARVRKDPSQMIEL